MKAQIVRLFGVIVVLFALLIVFTSRWTVFDAVGPRQQPAQRADADRRAEDQARAGSWPTTGPVLARSVRGPGGTWGRRYPPGRCSPSRSATRSPARARGRAGGSDDHDLRGTPERARLDLRAAGGTQQVGDDVYTTLDPKAQRSAAQELAGQAGSVVALDPQTGAVKVMYPTRATTTTSRTRQGPDAAVNRATRPVRAGLDVQDRHRRRGDRQRQVHARFGRQRQVADHRLRGATRERRKPELGHERPSPRR